MHTAQNKLLTPLKVSSRLFQNLFRFVWSCSLFTCAKSSCTTANTWALYSYTTQFVTVCNVFIYGTYVVLLSSISSLASRLGRDNKLDVYISVISHSPATNTRCSAGILTYMAWHSRLCSETQVWNQNIGSSPDNSARFRVSFWSIFKLLYRPSYSLSSSFKPYSITSSLIKRTRARFSLIQTTIDKRFGTATSKTSIYGMRIKRVLSPRCLIWTYCKKYHSRFTPRANGKFANVIRNFRNN